MVRKQELNAKSFIMDILVPFGVSMRTPRKSGSRCVMDPGELAETEALSPAAPLSYQKKRRASTPEECETSVSVEYLSY